MFEKRNIKRDILAIALCVCALFLAVSLISYNPADPLQEPVWPVSLLYSPDTLVYPTNEACENLFGYWGALAADMLFTGFGLGAWYILASLVALTYLQIRRRDIHSPMVRFIGWFASLVGVAVLASMLPSTLAPGPIIGPGGYLGVLGASILYTHFSMTGGAIIGASFVIAGVYLCTDFLVPMYAWKMARHLVRRRTVTDAEEMEEEEDEIEEAEDGPVIVRLHGRRRNDIDTGSEEEEYEEAEVEEEYEEDEEEADSDVEVVEAVRDRSNSSVRIKRKGRPSKEEEREAVIRELDEATLKDDLEDYELPSCDMLLESDEFSFVAQEQEVRRKAEMIESTFLSFGFRVKVVEIETGPVIAQYEVELEPGLRLSRITGLADDLAIALRVPSVRIVAPIPGKNTVGIEVPNTDRQVVRIREVIEESGSITRKMKIPLFLGKDVSGNPLAVDMATLPHLLIAGRTGTGKSVCLNAIISSILMTRRPDEVRMLMIDPKMVELSCYRTLPHLMHPVVTDMRKAEAILAWAVEKMEERYSLLARAGVRHVSVYNQLGEEELMERFEIEDEEDRESIPLNLPYIVIVADELADLMMTSGKEVEEHIIRLAQKSRAVGIHLILATQKPTVDVITGLIKSNLPARISFQVASRTDSRVVLDEMGADKLLGNGDMLFLWPGTSQLLRGQGTYVSDDEITSIVNHVSTGEQHFVNELVQLKTKSEEETTTTEQMRKRDDLYESAVDVIVREGRGSLSLLQRALGIGYGRAARLIDFMEEDGIVGAYAGSQAREVLISPSDWERMQGYEPEEEEPDAAKKETAPPPKKKKEFSRVPIVDTASEEEGEEAIFNGEAKEAALEGEDVAEDEEELEDEYEDGEEYEEDEYEEDQEEDAEDDEEEVVYYYYDNADETEDTGSEATA